MSQRKALTELTIQNAKAKAKPYNLSDGGGLYLHVSPNGSKRWQYVFRSGGKQYRGGLGPWGSTPPAQKIVAETAAGSVDELRAKYYKALEQIAAQAAELSALRAELDALKQEGAARAPLSAPVPASASGSENAA